MFFRKTGSNMGPLFDVVLEIFEFLLELIHFCTIWGFEIFPKMKRSRLLDDCILLGKCFIVKVIKYLDRRFIDLHVFNVASFFTSQHYYEEVNHIDFQTKI